MGFLSKLLNQEAMLSLQQEFKLLIIKKTKILAEYAKGLESIVDEAEEFKAAVGNVNAELLIKKITIIDDNFAKQEHDLFLDYAKVIKKYRKLSLVEIKQVHELALAEVKNKVNIAVAYVSNEAKNIMPTATRIKLIGPAKARLDYLANLTLDKQISEFEDILNKI